jgi:hypothetical protein
LIFLVPGHLLFTQIHLYPFQAAPLNVGTEKKARNVQGIRAILFTRFPQ